MKLNKSPTCILCQRSVCLAELNRRTIFWHFFNVVTSVGLFLITFYGLYLYLKLFIKRLQCYLHSIVKILNLCLPLSPLKYNCMQNYVTSASFCYSAKLQKSIIILLLLFEVSFLKRYFHGTKFFFVLVLIQLNKEPYGCNTLSFCSNIDSKSSNYPFI